MISWQHQTHIAFGFSPMMWRLGFRAAMLGYELSSKERGARLMEWRVYVLYAGPFSLRVGALPVASMFLGVIEDAGK